MIRRLDHLREVADFRAGQVCAIVANVNRDPEKQRAPWVPSDFFDLPGMRAAAPRDERPNDAQVEAWFRAMQGVGRENAAKRKREEGEL